MMYPGEYEPRPYVRNSLQRAGRSYLQVVPNSMLVDPNLGSNPDAFETRPYRFILLLPNRVGNAVLLSVSIFSPIEIIRVSSFVPFVTFVSYQ